MEGGVGSWLLLLDFDGVITRLDLDWGKIREEVGRAVGRRISSLNEFFEESYGTDEFAVAHSIVESHELEAIKNAKPIDEAVALLRASKAPVMISTMQSERAVGEFLVINGLDKHVDEILGRPRFGSKEAQFAWVEREKGYRPKDVLFVDDSMRNISKCMKFGFCCVLMRGEVLRLITELAGSSRDNPCDAISQRAR
ncbi:MAG: HAD hydrolase-like protein [Conexivisphaera sp.]|nr:HAD hydrolase-like protein [Conexivisphaerales archaeon]